MTNEEITDFIKELKEVSEEITGIVDDEVYSLINRRNRLLTKAADLIEQFNNIKRINSETFKWVTWRLMGR